MIQRQEIFNIVDLLISQPVIDFYQTLFDCIDLSSIPEFIQSKRGPIGYSHNALTRAFIVMNCEHFREITLLRDFLYSNLKIAQLCGFDITKKLPSYSVFQRHIKDKNSNLLADKGFDSRANYNYIKDRVHSKAFIGKNKRNTKNIETLSCGNPLCQVGLAMHKDGKQYLKNFIKPKYNNGHKNRGCVKYKSIGTDYRSSVDENLDYFKFFYKRLPYSKHFLIS